jgi:hypothetical protein
LKLHRRGRQPSHGQKAIDNAVEATCLIEASA